MDVPEFASLGMQTIATLPKPQAACLGALHFLGGIWSRPIFKRGKKLTTRKVEHKQFQLQVFSLLRLCKYGLSFTIN